MCNTTNTRRPAHLFYSALANWKNAAIEVEAVCPDDNADNYEQEVDRLADIASALQDAVFKYAAPDMAAIVAKLELAISSPEFIQIDYIRNAIDDLANLRIDEACRSIVAVDELSLQLGWKLRVLLFAAAGGVVVHRPAEHAVAQALPVRARTSPSSVPHACRS